MFLGIAMAVLNRCAVAVAAKPPMREWSRTFWSREDMESVVEEESLYLIPTYDDEPEAQSILRAHYNGIFQSELELWSRDPSHWPTPLSFDLFVSWFAVRFFPLIEDLAQEPLRSYGVENDFDARLHQALN
jgi:hypothetical protein